MRILGLVDLHWRGSGPAPLPPLDGYDMVLLGGDLTHMGDRALAARLLEPLRRRGLQVRAVCGNCDQPDVDEFLAEEGMALDRRASVVGDVRVLGLSGGLPFDGCPYERTEEQYRACVAELARSMEGAAAAFTVLVTHQPPFGTACDRLGTGQHVGSRAIRRFIEEQQPDVVLCGHIHESAGEDLIGRSRIVNPGPAFLRHRVDLQIDPGGQLEVRVV